MVICGQDLNTKHKLDYTNDTKLKNYHVVKTNQFLVALNESIC